MSIKNPIAWFEIYVDDMSRAKLFYENVFAVVLEKIDDPTDVNSMMEMLAFPSNMEDYGAAGAIVKMDGYPAGGQGTIVYFNCDDCINEESRVVTAGGNVTQTKMSIGEFGFMSLITDTEGNTIGLHSMN
ncbi:MAG: VOC family protein [Cocleimonas sp.]